MGTLNHALSPRISFGHSVRQIERQNQKCETCGEGMRQFVWKKPKSVLTKTGTYRQISCLTKTYRCLDCPGALSGRSSDQSLHDELSEGGGNVHVIQGGVVQVLSPEDRISNFEGHAARDVNVSQSLGQSN